MRYVPSNSKVIGLDKGQKGVLARFIESFLFEKSWKMLKILAKIRNTFWQIWSELFAAISANCDICFIVCICTIGLIFKIKSQGTL